MSVKKNKKKKLRKELLKHKKLEIKRLGFMETSQLIDELLIRELSPFQESKLFKKIEDCTEILEIEEENEEMDFNIDEIGDIIFNFFDGFDNYKREIRFSEIFKSCILAYNKSISCVDFEEINTIVKSKLKGI